MKIGRGEKCKCCGKRYLRNVAVDAVVVRVGKVLLIKRRNPPQRGYWALPGGLLDWDESAEEAVLRELKEEAGIQGELGKFVGVYSNPGRDDFQRVTIVYTVKKIKGRLRAGGDAAEARWFELDKLPRLAADHGRIIGDFRKISKLKSQNSKLYLEAQS